MEGQLPWWMVCISPIRSNGNVELHMLLSPRKKVFIWHAKCSVQRFMFMLKISLHIYNWRGHCLLNLSLIFLGNERVLHHARSVDLSRHSFDMHYACGERRTTLRTDAYRKFSEVDMPLEYRILLTILFKGLSNVTQHFQNFNFGHKIAFRHDERVVFIRIKTKEGYTGIFHLQMIWT